VSRYRIVQVAPKSFVVQKKEPNFWKFFPVPWYTQGTGGEDYFVATKHSSVQEAEAAIDRYKKQDYDLGEGFDPRVVREV
jgi:hypothetical protein